MTTSTGATEVWQARIGHQLAAQLREDAEVLGLDGRSDIVKAALQLIHQRAAEERMARSVDEFYGDASPPLPIGVARPEGSPVRSRRQSDCVDAAAGTLSWGGVGRPVCWLR